MIGGKPCLGDRDAATPSPDARLREVARRLIESMRLGTRSYAEDELLVTTFAHVRELRSALAANPATPSPDARLMRDELPAGYRVEPGNRVWVAFHSSAIISRWGDRTSAVTACWADAALAASPGAQDEGSI